MFSHRNADLIGSSLENSIYSSIEPQLLGNYIDHLVINEPDSFLILPLTIVLLEEEKDWYAHEVGAIIKKMEDEIVVCTIDKANISIKNRIKLIHPTLDMEIQPNKKKGIVEYKYNIKATPENIEKLSDILELGLLTDLDNIDRKIDLLMEYNIQELLFSELRELSTSEGWGTREGNYQQYLDNCFVKELDGTIKFVLFNESKSDISKSEPKQHLQEKIQHLSKNTKLCSTKEIYKDLIEIIDKQLELLQFDPLVYKKLISEIFQNYLYLKEARQSCLFQKKIQTKEASAIYSQRELHVPKLQSTNIKPIDFKVNITSLASEKDQQSKQHA